MAAQVSELKQTNMNNEQFTFTRELTGAQLPDITDNAISEEQFANNNNNNESQIESESEIPPEQAQEHAEHIAEQLSEVEQIQQQILSEDNFDFAALEATAAGQEGELPSQAEKSFSSSAYIEQNSSNDHSGNLLTPSDYLLNPSADGTENIPSESSLTSATPLVSSEPYSSSLIESIGTHLNEDLVISRSGKIDTPLRLEANQQTSELGTLRIEEDGSWQYIANNTNATIQSLGADDSLTDNFLIETVSGEQVAFSATIHGTNDRPIISGETELSIDALSNYEDGDRPETVHGKLVINDKDQDESHFIENESISTQYGEANIDAEGNWAYMLDSQLEAIQNLKHGEELTDTFFVQALDGTTQAISVTINGADDKPILSGKNSAPLTLSESNVIHDSLNINDPDFGQSYFIADTNIQSINGFGTGSIDKNGAWSFEANPNHPSLSSLEQGTNLIDYFFVHTADGTVQSVGVTISLGTEPAESVTSSLNVNELLYGEENSAEQSALDALAGDAITSKVDLSSATPSQSSLGDSYIELGNLGQDYLDQNIVNTDIS